MEHDDFNDFRFGHAVSDNEPIEGQATPVSDTLRSPGMDMKSHLAQDARQLSNEHAANEAILS